MTWNCEGLKTNIFTLKIFLREKSPDLCFLSEPQLFQSDSQVTLDYIRGDYCFALNSDDSHDPELPLVRNKSVGGTLCLWRKWLDPFVTVLKLVSPSFIPILIKLPNYQTSIHVAIYLPTHGKDTEFISALADLGNCLEELYSTYPGAALYIRGDGNVNAKNGNRVILLEHFLRRFSLVKANIPHKTYHHFVGHGAFDSDIDVILTKASGQNPEVMSQILCKFEHPTILSHHDIILSEFSLLHKAEEHVEQVLVEAPRLTLRREKIYWTTEGIELYEAAVTSHLQRLRSNWLDPSSQTSMSILLDLTNKILTMTAESTNQAKAVGIKQTTRSVKTPKPIIKAQKLLTKATRKCSLSLKNAKANYRRTVRRTRVKASAERDQKLEQILDVNPSSVFSFINSCRKSTPVMLEKLTVGNKVYSGSSVPDGFYDSMSSIKTCSIEDLQGDPIIEDHLNTYQHITKLCEGKHTIPPITMEKSTYILKNIKKNVRDIFNITAMHYINAGEEGLIHFNHLLNGIITDVNNASLEELNVALGLILYKGHNKEKTSHRAYRTISTCPFISKSLDLYLRDLYRDKWDSLEAETQYQGSGSNHELAALLVTEVIQHSLNVSHKPVFMLALDAESAFDRCLRQILCKELYMAKITGTALTFIDRRLAN